MEKNLVKLIAMFTIFAKSIGLLLCQPFFSRKKHPMLLIVRGCFATNIYIFLK